MSLLLSDELRIVLTPDHVLLARIRRSIGWNGLRRRVLAKETIPCASGDALGNVTPWAGALQVLEAALAKQAGRKLFARGKTFATVILSNHFMRYALLPWSDVPGDEAEELAYARHAFRQIYGDAAETWELRLSPGKAGLPQLACAVDSHLPDALRTMFGRSRIALESIQPHLMAAYNTCETILRERTAWFALVEPGSLCLALSHQGRLQSVRTMRLEGDGRVALPLILERESLLSESAAATDEVLLWAPWHGNALLPKSKQWRFRKLQPLLRAGLAPEPDSRFAVALSGCA